MRAWFRRLRHRMRHQKDAPLRCRLFGHDWLWRARRVPSLPLGWGLEPDGHVCRACKRRA